MVLSWISLRSDLFLDLKKDNAVVQLKIAKLKRLIYIKSKFWLSELLKLK